MPPQHPPAAQPSLVYVLSGAIGSYFPDAVAADASWHFVCVNATQTMTKPLSLLLEESKAKALFFVSAAATNFLKATFVKD